MCQLYMTLALNALQCFAAQGHACEDLAMHVADYSSFSITNSSQVSAQSISFPSLSTLTNELPLCRVKGQVGYGLNNSIGVEVWMPSAEKWNGRYLVVGNGGLAGVIDYAGMLQEVNAGYAVAAGDSGHLLSNNGNGTTEVGQNIPFLQDQEQTIEWIRQSIASLTTPTRDLVERFYGQPPSHSYFQGCSTGGAQGFALAQYHPELFDGIIAGCPGNWYSHLILSFLWNYLAAKDALLAQDTLTFIANATIKSCDGADGVMDGVIENPLECQFNISQLQCASGQAPNTTEGVQCLTEKQIATYKAIRAGPKESDTGRVVYPGFESGSESLWLYQETVLAFNYTVPIIQNLVFKDLKYDYTSFNFSSEDLKLVDSRASPYIDSISPDLLAYKNKGGKLIVYQGWADPLNAPTWPIKQLEQTDAFLTSLGSFAGNASEFYRLFMVPGGGHCGASAPYPQTPGTYHVLDALTAWAENGTAPLQIESSGPLDHSNRTRKLCP
ncbi:hypothetical protein LTR84_004092 [Exophiala bonariae]|uniref:Carboxylic ester hydrolase n=1 Tax=Exophiala bonariae TaxID=1690606 RepID=A0AAV9N5P0_9EURO|nr:hypothetical protein LTR84_004092 [Exophiala bonariae]